MMQLAQEHAHCARNGSFGLAVERDRSQSNVLAGETADDAANFVYATLALGADNAAEETRASKFESEQQPSSLFRFVHLSRSRFELFPLPNALYHELL